MSQPTQPDAVVAIIPARGGSKGVPLKNLERVGGLSLVSRAVSAAGRACSVDRVVVSTDHPGIAAEAERFGASIVWRPPELSGDTASSESALLHAMDAMAVQPEIVVFVQATSPFLDPLCIDRAVERVRSGQADVVLSAVRDHGFLWAQGADGSAIAVGHDAAQRPRRQDREPQYRETGAFYVMRAAGFRSAGHRFFGRVEIQEVSADEAPEIDSYEDLDRVRQMAAAGTDAALPAASALVTDFDGVHTDDGAWVDEDGREMVRVHRGDGLGIARLRALGVPVLILSKERNPVVSRRAAKLGVDVLQGVDDKAEALRGWLAGLAIDAELVVYVGNDVNDIEVMSVVGWPVAVADAHPEVIARARRVLKRAGGNGAVREVCDGMLAAHTAKKGEKA